MSASERKVLRVNFWRITVNENCRKQDNKPFMQLFGDLDVLSFIRTNLFNCIGHEMNIEYVLVMLIEWKVKEKKSHM